MGRNLGKGLAALFGEEDRTLQSTNESRVPDTLPLTSITPNPKQPRYIFNNEAIDDLLKSIEQKGILQPLLVRSVGEGKYQLIAGERRWRAATKLGLGHVPVRVIECDEQEALEIALIENLQRENLNPLEEAQSLLTLHQQYNRPYEEIARSVGKSRSYVVNMIRLNGLPDGIKKDLQDGQLTISHARSLLNTDDPQKLWAEVKAKNLSVRETEQLASQSKKPTVLNPPLAVNSSPIDKNLSKRP